jgi:hypothetical protein
MISRISLYPALFRKLRFQMIDDTIDQILANSEVYRREAGGQPMGPNNQGASVVNGVTPTPPAASVPH